MASGSSKRRKRRTKRAQAVEGDGIATASNGKCDEGFFDASEALEQEEDKACITEQIRVCLQRRHDLPGGHVCFTPGAREYLLGRIYQCYMFHCSRQKVSVEEYFSRWKSFE